MYRYALSVDGDRVAQNVVDDADGTCADVEPANDDPYEFGAPQPCPLAASGEASFDTATLHDGPHTLHLTLEDAAGNVDLVDDETFDTHNAPIALAAPGVAGTARVGSQLTAGTGQWDGAPDAYGYRWLRCDASGGQCAGIAGADDQVYTPTTADAYHRLAVEVTAGNASGSATASATGSLVADTDGHLEPPAGASGAPRDAQPQPATGGIGGLTNPLGQLDGHVANGSNAASGAHIDLGFRLADGRLVHRARSPRSHHWVLAGRLTDADGHAIAHARLGLAWKVLGRPWAAHGEIRTDADGRFATALPEGPSRLVKVTYFPFSDSRGFAASNVVREDVLAPLTIHADRRRLTGDRVVRLRGHVGGELLPRSGVLVTLQGYQAGFGWRTFRTVRTSRRGDWSTQYRFRLASGRFGFRALVPQQGSFPFLTSRSSPVYVTVG